MNRYGKLVVVTAAAMLFCASSDGVALADNGLFIGEVRIGSKETNKPLAKATIELRHEEKALGEAVSNSKGRYAIKAALKDGDSYEIIVKYSGEKRKWKIKWPASEEERLFLWELK